METGSSVIAGILLTAVAAGVPVPNMNETHRNGIGAMIRALPGQLRKADPAAPDLQATIYGGYTSTLESDVVLRQPNGTDMTIRDVRWGSEPKQMPPYHGFRGTWWLPFGSLGAMGDLVYIKVVAERERAYRQSGTRDGEAVPESEPLARTFDHLEFTNGLNILTGNLIYRLPFFGRVRPYIAFGAGLSVPHAEVRRTGKDERTHAFQLTGFAFQVLVGIEFQLASRGSVFTEYRTSYSTNKVRLHDGGSLHTNLLTHHFSAGGSGHLRPQRAVSAP